MGYFSDIRFVGGGHDPDCRHGGIDSRFSDFYSIQFDREGPITLAIDHGEPVELPCPVVYLLHPAHHYAYQPADACRRWSHGWVGFQGPRAERIFNRGFAPLVPAGYLHPARPEAFAALFDEMIGWLHQPNEHVHAVLALEKLLALLLDDTRQTRQQHPVAAGIARLADRIAAEPFQGWDPRTCAADLHISYSHFRKRFRAQTGTSPYDYMLHARMQKAADAIAQGHLPVKAVAARHGYEDLATFSRLFKKQIGVPPREYARMMGR